jgi:membrane-anchored glycerophosphoryl diester phosphodiesterase (GDPDase)
MRLLQNAFTAECVLVVADMSRVLFLLFVLMLLSFGCVMLNLNIGTHLYVPDFMQQ